MRTQPIQILGLPPEPAALVASPALPRIDERHRAFTLVQRDADGSVPSHQGAEYAEAMAQSIELCARDIRRGDALTFEDLWSRASNTLSSFFLGRRGLSLMRRATRSQTDLHAAARDRRLGAEGPPRRLFGARGVGWGLYVRDPDGNRVELRHYGGEPCAPA